MTIIRLHEALFSQERIRDDDTIVPVSNRPTLNSRKFRIFIEEKERIYEIIGGIYRIYAKIYI